MDRLKEKIEQESEQVLKVVDLKVLLSLGKDEQVNYLEGILYDFWETQDERIKQAVKLGEKKAKKLINVTS